MPEERTFVFWFMSNVMRLELRATSRDEAWAKLKTAILTDMGTQQHGLLNLDGEAELSVVNIADEDRWELDEETDARENALES